MDAIDDRAGTPASVDSGAVSPAVSSYYHAPVPETDETLALMAEIDNVFMD